jgi:hypothetical protein
MKIKLPPFLHNLFGIVQSEVGPEVLPASMGLLTASLGVFALVQFWAKIVNHSVGGAAAIGVFAAIILIVVAYVAARLLGFKERFVQTLTALAAAGAIVAVVNLLCRMFLRVGFDFMLDSEGPIDSMIDFLLFPIFLWNLIVYAGIFRRAYSVGLGLGFALSLICVLMISFELPRLFK